MDIFLNHLSTLITSIPNIEFQTKIELWEIDCIIEGKFNMDTSSCISKRIEKISQLLSSYHKKTEQKLIKNLPPNALINTLNFPKRYQNICNQYLMYFGEFLNDLGMSSDLAVETKGDTVILSVEPHDQNEALSKIHQALTAYLSLPVANLAKTVTPSEGILANIKYQQLLSVVDHLKSQLRLQEALISAKELHIASLAESNCEISNINAIILNSHVASTLNRGNKMSFLGGTV